jgi:hypothetical protein
MRNQRNREVEKGKEGIKFRKSEVYGMDRNKTAGWDIGYLDVLSFFGSFSFLSLREGLCFCPLQSEVSFWVSFLL